jgi:hypothetical protein
MTTDLQNATLPSGATQAAPAQKLSWREKRWLRRRRRGSPRNYRVAARAGAVRAWRYWIVTRSCRAGTSLPADRQGVQTIIASQL